eukprot:5530710-Pyramimonas_sp.AAC.1
MRNTHSPPSSDPTHPPPAHLSNPWQECVRPRSVIRPPDPPRWTSPPSENKPNRKDVSDCPPFPGGDVCVDRPRARRPITHFWTLLDTFRYARVWKRFGNVRICSLLDAFGRFRPLA